MRYWIYHQVSSSEAYEFWAYTDDIELYCAQLVAKKGGTVEYR